MAADLQSLLRNDDPVRMVKKDRSGWSIGRIPSFVGGMNDAVPADLIEDTETALTDNYSYIGGSLKSDTGWIRYASQLRETPKGMFEHKQADGSSTRLCVTNKTVYKYNVTHDEWQVVKGTHSPTLTADLLENETEITVASPSGWAVGAVFGVVLDGGAHLIRTVTGIAASVISFSPAAGATSSVIATSGNSAVLGPILAGDDSNQIVFTAIPDQEWTVFTNGVNVPYRYDATSDDCVTIASLGDLPTTTVCKTLGMFKSTLILANLIEAGTYRNYKLQWAKPGDPTDWTDTNAGNNSLLDSRDAIMAIKPIGSNMGVYRSNSIVTMSYQGASGNAFFRFDTSIYGEIAGSQGVGAVSPNAVFALPDEAVILTSDGIYLYRGGFNIQLISDPVFKGTFGAQGDMDGQSLNLNFVHFFDRTNEVFFFYRSTIATAFPDRALVLNLSTGKFRKRDLGGFTHNQEITCAADTSDVPTFTAIDDLVGSIDDQAWLLGSDAAVSGIGTVLLGTNELDYVMEYNYITQLEDDLPFIAEFRTKEISAGDRHITLDWIEFNMAATVGAVFYSTDLGQTWIGINDWASDADIPGGGSSSDIKPRRMHLNITDRRFQFRVRTVGSAEIHGMSFRYKEAVAAL